MNLPTGEKLILTIDREVEVECATCEGSGNNIIADLQQQALGEHEPDCQQCHGTGRITKRVRGWCEVEADYHGNSAQMRTSDGMLNMGSDTFTGLSAGLTGFVVERYLAGTLPAEIAANIEMEDI